MGENVCLWSLSGDTDIVVLAVGLLQEFNDLVFIVNGCGSNTEHYKLSDFEIDIESTSALLGLHAFTRNDYVSSFFRKGKEKCCKVTRKSRKFEDTLGKLGKEWELTDELFSHLEEFICTLYGYKEKNVNKVRWLKFRDKHTKQNKVINMSALPPCKETLKLHSVRANYVAKCGDRLCKAILMLPISVVMIGIQTVRQNGL